MLKPESVASMLDLTQDFFSLFNLPREYRIDLDALMDRYRELQRLVHPDRYAHASDQERRLSMQWAAFVNEALSTLKQPLNRAIYLLELHLGQESEWGSDPLPPAFLMEQMELREMLEDARGAADPYAVLDKVGSQVGSALKAYHRRLEQLFKAPTDQDLSAAVTLVREMQFLDKVQHEAELLEADFEDNGF